MAMTFDATLKDMGRECPEGFLATFDRPPSAPLRLLNVDLSTVTRSGDFIVGLGEPLEEIIIHFDFQSSAAAWKHADLMVYNALLYAQHHVPVHTIVLLLRPEAAHSNLNGALDYAARQGRGRMTFRYEVVALWERPAEEYLASDVGIAPLAMLGRLPEGIALEDALAGIAHRLVERLIHEAAPDRAKKLMTDALLLTGLRVRRDMAVKIFQGVRMMEESDTYLMIVDEGREKQVKKDIILAGEERLGAPEQHVKGQIESIKDLERLERMMRRALKATSWNEILGTT